MSFSRYNKEINTVSRDMNTKKEIVDSTEMTNTQLDGSRKFASQHLNEIDSAFNNKNIKTSNLSTILNTPIPKIDFIQAGFKLGTVGFLNAPGATGKSFFAIQTAMSIASHNRYRLISSLNYMSGRVTYITGEDDLSTLNIRMRAISKDFDQKTIEKISENLTVVDVIAEGIKFLDFNAHNKIQKNEKAISILNNIAKHSDLIILDTLSRFHYATENSNGEMSMLLGIFEKIAQSNNCSVLILHHTNKSSSTNNNQDQQSARGASALIDNCRYMISLMKMSKEDSKIYFGKEDDSQRDYYIKCSFPKANYTAPISDIWLKKTEGGKVIEIKIPFSSSNKGSRYGS